MTVAGKVNALTIAVALVGGLLFAVIAIRNQYVEAREDLLLRAQQTVENQSQLQLAVYFRDQSMLRGHLEELLSLSDAVRFAAIVDSRGANIVRLGQPGAPQYEPAGFRTMRHNAGTLETTVTVRAAPAAPELGPLGQVVRRETLWDLAIPVTSLLNPLEPNLQRADFGRALIDTRASTSLYVTGFTHIGISRDMLWLSLAPGIGRTLGLVLVFVALCAIVGAAISRRITAPFASIVRMAEDISAGRDVQTSGLEHSGEFRELVGLLNGMIDELRTRSASMEVNQQLLTMKVEERTSQLSRRNEELNQAVAEITETKDRLRQLAYYDSLTTLPNRRLFTEQLDLLLRLARRNEEMIGLLFLDLDNFKRINDSLGHSAGDLLLREAARRLSRCVRDSDLVGHNVEPNSAIDVSRLGGDEFTVVLNALSTPDAPAIVARRLIEALREPITIEGHELTVTPSVGIAVAPNDADTVEGLLRAADMAMYHAKKAGKNNFVFYHSDMDAAGVERLTLENDLRRAVERDELVLHYQPQVDTLTGNIIGAEALMRWEHPEHGLVPPFKFIPLAEEMGLIGALGEWGLEEACRQMIELQAEGLDLPKVSVNVSALQFNRAFINRLGEVLAKTGLKPSRLELELTEGIMIDSSSDTVAALEGIKEKGVRLSMDDFGTGYSSLSYLSRFPLDELKIDRSFVVAMENSSHDASLVIAIIAMARSLGLEIVAEGVETHEQYRFLRQHGASVIQGYLFSKPLPVEELKPMLVPGYFSEQLQDIKVG